MMYLYNNKLYKASTKVEAIHKIIADTDELDDADLGINVDHKEYHKQKSKMRSLQQRLDAIKRDINKETDSYIEELESVAKKLNEQNRTEYHYDNDSDKWLHYKGNINEKVIMNAFKDGVKAAYYGPLLFSYIFKEGDDFETTYKKALSYFKKSKVYKTIKEILVNRSNKVKVYRGLLIEKDYDNVKYMKYNLLDRNSWTLSFKVAVVYADKPYLNKEGIVISMDCCIDSINIPLSVWLYGRWLCNENKELNLYESLKVNDIKVVASSKDNFKYHSGGI